MDYAVRNSYTSIFSNTENLYGTTETNIIINIALTSCKKPFNPTVALDVIRSLSIYVLKNICPTSSPKFQKHAQFMHNYPEAIKSYKYALEFMKIFSGNLLHVVPQEKNYDTASNTFLNCVIFSKETNLKELQGFEFSVEPPPEEVQEDEKFYLPMINISKTAFKALKLYGKHLFHFFEIRNTANDKWKTQDELLWRQRRLPSIKKTKKLKPANFPSIPFTSMNFDQQTQKANILSTSSNPWQTTSLLKPATQRKYMGNNPNPTYSSLSHSSLSQNSKKYEPESSQKEEDDNCCVNNCSLF